MMNYKHFRKTVIYVSRNVYMTPKRFTKVLEIKKTQV
jgi:hypothetical protein